MPHGWTPTRSQSRSQSDVSRGPLRRGAVTRHRTPGVLARHGWREAQEAISMAEGPRAIVRLMASRLDDTPSAGRSGEELAQATGLRVRDINQAVDWLECSGGAHVDRALGGSPSSHLCVAVALTARGRRAYEQQRLSREGRRGKTPAPGRGRRCRVPWNGWRQLGNLTLEQTCWRLCGRWRMSSDLEGRL